jgi:hypothetical protein
MGARADKYDKVSIEAVDKQKVTADMALAVVRKISFQRVV